MEAIFHVRYWDYTNIPTNIKGYISLPTSIVWGFFSILMIKFIHKPIEHAVLDLSQTATEVRDIILVHGLFVCLVLFSEALSYGVQVGVAGGTLDKGDDSIVGF